MLDIKNRTHRPTPLMLLYTLAVLQLAWTKIDLKDPAEHVERLVMPVAELKKMVDNQEIVDSSLLIAWYAARDRGLIKG